MSVEIWIGSRKGLFIARHKKKAWAIEDVAFLGVPVTMLLRDARSDLAYAALDRGLPGEHACDLVFRHGLDVSTGAGLLAMGSTSGSAWVSEDQGDSWATISNHLPPIYCLRMIEDA